MNPERSLPEVPDFGDIPDPFDHAAWESPRVPPRPAVPYPTRERTRAARGMALVLALAYEAVLIAAYGSHTVARTSAAVLVGAAIPGAAGLLALVASVHPGPRGLGLPRPALTSAAIAVPVLFCLGALIWLPGGPGRGDFTTGVLTCIMNGAVLTAGPVALAATAWRRAFPAASEWRTAALGAACGSLGATALAVICADGSALHVILGHGAAIVLGGLVGAVLARLTAI